MSKLTALSVKAAKEPGRYHDGDGLMLVVKSATSRSWLLRMQVNGKRRDFGLGSLSKVSLSEAREKARETRALYASGIDPVMERKRKLTEMLQTPSFETAARAVFEEHKHAWKNAKHRAQWITTLETYVFPYIGYVRIDEVTGPMIRDAVIGIWLTKLETARRVLQRIGTVLDWAHAKGYRDHEAPLRSVRKGLPKQPRTESHFAAMPYADLPAFMVRLSEKDSVGRLALRFLILTAARSGEVRLATWDEIDEGGKAWRIPGERMKAGKDHHVPLSEAALAVLDTLRPLRAKGDLIFPGIRKGKPLSNMTLTKALHDLGHGDVTVHGFRSSFRDWAAEQTTVPGDVVEAALAHTIRNRVEAAYRRTNYFDKRIVLMDKWAEFLSNTR